MSAGGTPSRKTAAQRRARILRLIRMCGTTRTAVIAAYYPEISKPCRDKYLQALREAGAIKKRGHGRWAVAQKGSEDGR